jgi:hypothetical protein
VRRHRFDPISLVFGLAFTAAATIVLAGGSLIDDGHFLVPTTLVGLGIALLAQTATRNRPTRDPITVGAPTTPLAAPTPTPEPYAWSWDRTPSGVETAPPSPTAATSTPVDIPDLPDLPDLPEPAPADEAPARTGWDDDAATPAPQAGPDGADVGDESAGPTVIADPSEDSPLPASALEPQQDDDDAAPTIEEPADLDAGLDDPTIEEPARPGTDAWVWKRIEAEDGTPTWVRRPDTDDEDDDGKTQSPGSS